LGSRRKAPHGKAAPFARPQSCGTLIIMAKQPVMGRLKTRLAREVGAVEAIRFYRNALRCVVARLSRDPRWQTLLAISPDTSIGAGCWPNGVARAGQGRGDLGTRMQRLLELPRAGRVVLIGSDIPAVGPSHIADAFGHLGRNDVVFGPAVDGGFWLVGLRSCPRPGRPFGSVRWSHPETLADTLRNLGYARVGFAARLGDVDTAGDLRNLGGVAARVILRS
jgi:rSAM/selenodomain-associated transferase 1